MSQPFDPTAEAGASNLQRALGQLPAHEPDPAAWRRIAAQLDADAALARAIPNLPAHEPDDTLWLAIATRLDAPAEEAPAPAPALVAPGVVRSLPLAWWPRVARRSLSLAASVLLVLGLWWQLRPVGPAAEGPHETLAFSEEVLPESSPAAPAFDPLAQQGLAFIDAQCTSQPAVCGSGEFRVLRSQLAELEAEQARLTEDARRFGESPELRREQTRLITLQARLTRELVHLIIT
jgi:hypothetical protein